MNKTVEYFGNFLDVPLSAKCVATDGNMSIYAYITPPTYCQPKPCDIEFDGAWGFDPGVDFKKFSDGFSCHYLGEMDPADGFDPAESLVMVDKLEDLR